MHWFDLSSHCTLVADFALHMLLYTVVDVVSRFPCYSYSMGSASSLDVHNDDTCSLIKSAICGHFTTTGHW